MESETRLITLVASARRRAAGNLVCDQLTVGAAAAFGGAILLLLVGTQILHWYWLVVLFAAGAGLSAWRTVSRYPSAYRVAQIIDRRLNLSDALSTAYHFLTAGSGPRVEPAVVAAQREQAEAVAVGIDAATAMPFRLPRHFYPMLAMAAIAGSLFAIRYGVKGSLDLKTPIVESVADFFYSGGELQARNRQQARRPGDEAEAPATDKPNAETPELDQAPENALTPIEVPDTSQALDAPLAERAKQGDLKAAGEMADENAEGSDEPGRGEGDEGKEGDAGKPEPAPDGSPKDAPDKANQGAGGENSSLLDKMKDAMANLMSKLKIPQQAGQSKQGQPQQSGQKEGQRQEGGSGQKGEKGQGQQAKGAASDDVDAEGQESQQQAQAGQGKSNEKGSEAGSPNEAKSGMGKQDGSKDLRDAQQLEAMGKLSEIFGKRAQTITGEVMVEVQSGKQQQLRTGYTQKGASHREAGGEIHRDEIPAELQHYVQQYFEQVRKSQPPAAAAPGDTKR